MIAALLIRIGGKLTQDAIVVLVAIALVAGGYIKGSLAVHAEWDADKARRAARAAEVKADQADATVHVVTQYVDRVKVVRQAGDTIIKEVPVYVSPEADAACVLSRGFVRLHDAAAAGVVPDPAGGPDAAPAGIALSAVAGTVADNYERCHENAEQLTALQVWIHEMGRAAAAPRE